MVYNTIVGIIASLLATTSPDSLDSTKRPFEGVEFGHLFADGNTDPLKAKLDPTQFSKSLGGGGDATLSSKASGRVSTSDHSSSVPLSRGTAEMPSSDQPSSAISSHTGNTLPFRMPTPVEAHVGQATDQSMPHKKVSSRRSIPQSASHSATDYSPEGITSLVGGSHVPHISGGGGGSSSSVEPEGSNLTPQQIAELEKFRDAQSKVKTPTTASVAGNAPNIEEVKTPTIKAVPSVEETKVLPVAPIVEVAPPVVQVNAPVAEPIVQVTPPAIEETNTLIAAPTVADIKTPIAPPVVKATPPAVEEVKSPITTAIVEVKDTFSLTPEQFAEYETLKATQVKAVQHEQESSGTTPAVKAEPISPPEEIKSPIAQIELVEEGEASVAPTSNKYTLTAEEYEEYQTLKAKAAEQPKDSVSSVIPVAEIKTIEEENESDEKISNVPPSPPSEEFKLQPPPPPSFGAPPPPPPPSFGPPPPPAFGLGKPTVKKTWGKIVIPETKPSVESPALDEPANKITPPETSGLDFMAELKSALNKSKQPRKVLEKGKGDTPVKPQPFVKKPPISLDDQIKEKDSKIVDLEQKSIELIKLEVKTPEQEDELKDVKKSISTLKAARVKLIEEKAYAQKFKEERAERERQRKLKQAELKPEDEARKGSASKVLVKAVLKTAQPEDLGFAQSILSLIREKDRESILQNDRLVSKLASLDQGEVEKLSDELKSESVESFRLSKLRGSEIIRKTSIDELESKGKKAEKDELDIFKKRKARFDLQKSLGHKGKDDDDL